jgi:hypothetical protein
VKFKGGSPSNIDFWVLISFGILFILIQVSFLFVFFWVTRDTRELVRKEKKFMDKFCSSGRNITPEEEADYCYHYYKRYKKHIKI